MGLGTTPRFVNAEPVDVSQYVTVSTANQRSVLDRRTRKVTSTADVTITNASSETIESPLHAVIDIVDTAYENVVMPDALGGPGIDPYQKYYFELDSQLPYGRFASGESVTFQVKFVRSYTIRFRYNVLVYGELETGTVNHAPTADPGGPYSAMAGEAISFDGSGSSDPDDDPLVCTWDFGDANTGSGVAPVHSYTAPNTYTVTLTVSDGRGGTDTAQVQVNILAENLPPQITSSPVTVIEEGVAYTYQAVADDPNNDPLEFLLFQGPEGMTLDPETGLIAWPFPIPGTLSITVAVTDGNGGTDMQTFDLVVSEVPNRAPAANAGGPYAALVGQKINCDGTGSADPDGDTLSFEWDFGDGTAGTGEVPVHTYVEPGNYIVMLTVTDPEGAFSTAQTEATIEDINHPPALLPLEDITVKESQPLSFQVTGTDPDNDPMTFTHSPLPEGAVFNAGDQTFAWTPTYDQAGAYPITFTVTDPEGLSGSDDATITVTHVNRPPILDPVSDRDIAETKTLTFRVKGRDPDGDDLTYDARNLPGDASFDAGNQTFSWTPASGYAGVYHISFTVTDGYLSDEVSARIFVTAFDINNSPSLTPVASQVIDEAQLLQFQVMASDPNNDELTLDSAGLPEGASFEPTEDPNVYDFAWTPGYDQAGTYTLNFTATDPGGLLDAINVDIVVNNVNRPPSLDPLPDRHISETKPLTFQATGSDPDDDALLFYVENLPEGASFGTEIPVFSWSPTEEQAGLYTVDVFVSDGDLTDSQSVQITVLDYNTTESPVLIPVADQQVIENQTLTFGLTATDPNGDALVYSQPALPSPGARFIDLGDGTATFSWMPNFDEAGNYTINFTVSDGTLEDTVDVNIAVLDVNREPVLDPIENQSINENEVLTLQLSGGDPDDDTLTFGSTGLPQGSTLDPETAVFAWQPTYDQAGDYDVTFFVSDGEFSAEQQVLIAVEDVNRVPAIVTTTLPDGRVDQVYHALIEAEDPDGDTLQYSIFETSAPVTIDPDTGQLSWDRPSISDIGSYNLSVRVEDPSGDFATRAYALKIPDTIPPAITLNVPVQAHPGAIVSIVANATDNDAITAIEIADSRTDFPEPYTDFVTHPMDITMPSEIGINTVSATAWDSSGNTTVATATINIIAAFDTTAPQVTLSAPSRAAREQAIRLTASVVDAVGVSTVTFFADGTAVGSASGLQPYLNYQIPAGASGTIQFRATAVDFSGNSGESPTVNTAIVNSGEEDNAPPETGLTTPESVAEDIPIPVTVDTPNETCLAQIDAYVNHTLAATYFAPAPGTFDVPMPEGIDAGMAVLLEVVVTDCSGNQTTTSDWLDIEETGTGVVAGEVYDDKTGRPLEGADVTFIGADGSALSLTTDDRGQYSFAVKAGTGHLTVTMAGYSTVERAGLAVSESAGLEVYDARLTPISDLEITVPATMGAGIETPFSIVVAGFAPVLENEGIDPSSMVAADMSLDIPAGALTQNTSLRLTQISPQGLQGALPAGWSPVGSANIHPHAVALQTPATLSIPNPLGLDPGSGIALVAWNETEHAWRVISTADMSADGTAISGQISSTGQFAFVLPDVSPQAPPAPVAGEPLGGVSPLLIHDPVTTVISPEPRIIFYRPGVHSDLGVTVSDLPGLIPSGAPVLIHIAEEYNFYSGNRIVSTPYTQDIILYSLNRPELTAGFPVTPSYTFEPLALEQGTIDVDALAPTDMERGLHVVPSAGGTVTLPTGESLFLPENASAEIIPVTLESLAVENIGIEMPSGLSFLGGALASFSGHELEAPAVLSIPVPAGLTEQDQVLLLRLMEIDGVTRMVFAGLGEIQGASLVSLSSLPGMDEPLLVGILTGGRYIFVRTSSAIGFSYGQVFDTRGISLEEALVTVDDMPFVTVSGADGAYALPVNADMFSLTALDLQTMDSGSSTGFVSTADEAVELDLYLMANPPYVVSCSPPDGQTNVPLETSVKITFSEPLDVTTTTPDNLILTGPEGPVSGTLTLSSGNRQIDFRPDNPLAGDTTYSFTAFTNISDLAGYMLEDVFVLSFTTLDTTPPPLPPAGNIAATIPDDTGRTTITATQGTAGPHDSVSIINQTQNTSTPVLVEADGSFSATIDAQIIDEVVISITDPAGNQAFVSTGLFRNPDGSIGVGPQGAKIEAGNGAVLDIPEGAFPNGAIVRFTGLREAEIGINPGPDFPFVSGFEIECSVAPEIYMNASAPLPAGTSSNTAGIVARLVDVYGGEQALAIVDTAKVIDGRLTTSSPPCPGIMQRVGRYAMYLNEDQRMATAQSLVSIVATGMHDVTIQALIENIGGNPVDLYNFIAYAANAGHALNDMYEQTCMPVPPDTPLQVVIRDAETREALNVLDIDPLAPFQSAQFHASVYYAATEDDTAPAVIGTRPINRILDGYNKRIEIRFSEPVDHMSLLGAGLQDIFLTAEDDEDTVYTGTWQLSENNTRLVFETSKQLPLGKKFRLHLENIKDLAGNRYQNQPIIFTTFKPKIIFPTTSSHLNRNDIAAGLGIDVQNIPEELWFKDVDFITRSPDESYDGRWHTTLAALQGGLVSGVWAHELFTFDLSDPSAPAAKGGSPTDPRFYQTRLRLLDNVAITPREDSWADPQFWESRLLYYQINDPSIRLCIDPADPDPETVNQWIEKNCRPEDGGCDIINGGCGDLAVTTVYDGKYSYLWTYDVTNDDEFKWASSRLLSDNGDPRRYEAPAGMGFPHGFSVLPGMDIPHGDLLHQDTVGVYVATAYIGLELVDLGLNIPTITDPERASEEDYPWGYAETIHLNAQLYYRDVAVVPSKTKADSTVIPPKVVAIASDPKDGTDIKTLEIFRADLAGEPTGIKPLTHLPNHLAVATNIPVHDASEIVYYDLALITTDNGGMYLYEIPEDGSAPQKSQFFVDTPAGVITNYIEVDSEAMLAYVGASNINETTGGDGLLIVDISEPFAFREDEDGDGWNDRIIGRLPITVSGYAGPVKLNGFRVDRERGLVYAGVKADGQQALVVAKVRDCPDLSIDFKAIPEPAPAPEQVEKNALEQIISAGLEASGMPTGSVAVLAYGEKACLWKEGCQNTDSNNRQYRFAALIPESEWEKRDLLLANLYEQVIGPDGRPKSIEALGFQVTFEDIEFIPVKYEEFITANISLNPVGEDYGLAKQTQLLEWLLTGAYVEGPSELRQNSMPLDLIITLLTDTCDQGECVTDEPSHIWRQEGLEFARLQEAEFFRSGALIRFYGETEADTTLNASLQEDLQEVSTAALKTALARIIANEEGNRFLAFQADTYKGFGLGITTHDSLDPAEWEPTLFCNSFEHWVASMAARTVQENLGIFTIEEIIGEVYAFQKVADGEKQFSTAEEANAFIAMAYQFIQDVTSGFVWSIYQAKLLDDPNQEQRSSNMAALEANIIALQQNGRKEIKPRLVNTGPENADDTWVRMYETPDSSGSSTMTTEKQLDLNAGSERHPPGDAFVLENIQQTDTGVNGWCSFLVDIPEKTVREADRENNWINLFFYVLDPADPVVPPLPAEPDLPVEDPHAGPLEGDPACLCRSPELNIAVSSAGMDTLELNPGDCADVDVRVVNTGNEGLRDVRLYSTFPGNEDWTHDIPEIGPGEEIVFTFQYCVPDAETNDLAGYVWFEELDKEYDPPPAESNLFNIDVIQSVRNVDAKANGKDEIFVGSGWDVTFSVEFDQTNCTNPRYFWDLGDAKGLYNTPGGTYSYDKGGTYKAKVRVTCDEGFEEDIVNVHVVDVEILVNNTLDDPNVDEDDGELDDAVRLKAPRPENETRVFKTPCQARLKEPLSKDAWVMLMSPESRLGFAADSGTPTSTGMSIWELTLPKDGGLVNFAITGELGSDQLNDARIRALLEDPGTPVAEENVTVYWYDEAKIEIEVCGVYGIHGSEKVTKINNKCTGDIEKAALPGYHDLRCEASPYASTPFPTRAVFMKAKATLKPTGACAIPQTAQTRIGITQNCTDIVNIVEYHEPDFEWDWAGQGAVQSIPIYDSIRITDKWPQNYPGWIFDGSVDKDKECDGHPEIKDVYSCPLYAKNFSFDYDTPTYRSPVITRPPAPCNNSTFLFTHPANGPTYTDSGIWLNDAPSRNLISDTYPKDQRRIPVTAGPDDDTVVGWLKYNRRGKVIKKERFRTWVVTYWRQGSYDTYGPPEEIIPLREIEWWIDLDTSAVDANGVPDLSKHQAQADPHDTEPEHFPIITGPVANDFQPTAHDPDLKIIAEEEYFGDTHTEWREE